MAFPKKVGTEDLSRLLGIKPRQITKLVEQKVLTKDARGVFDVEDCVQAYIAFKMAEVASAHGAGRYGAARAALYIERARIARLQRERLEGSSMSVNEGIAAGTAHNMVVKTAMLGIPSKAAPQLVGLKTAAEVESILRPFVMEALEGLHALAAALANKRTTDESNGDATGDDDTDTDEAA